ncbi:hypothetical protein LTR62_008213 [Meristemomyces frigidus]|uniref:UBC core domain-containing protein n=1 Tax=Meristemomyces frigidus TaxID=1508187 RepID=A0AAN7TL42_9PEZI|nr:hypothetical protein LTR62_008213 [Meristemomyces frigidus]
MESTLHVDDIVESLAVAGNLGVVERTHADIDTHNPRPQDVEDGPIKRHRDIPQPDFRRFLKDGIPPKGTVLVRWQNSQDVQLAPADKMKVLDRSLLIGDVVKKDAKDAMSGVIINTHIKCALQPVYDVTFKGRTLKGLLPPTELLPGFSRPSRRTRPPLIVDVPSSELQEVDDLAEESLVIYKDWIGTVIGLVEKLTLKLTDNCVVELINGDDRIEHADGAHEPFAVGDLVVTKKGDLRTGRWIFGQYNPNTPPVGTVVESRPSSIDVSWLQRRIGSAGGEEPPAVLEREELESEAFKVYDRSRRPATQRYGSAPNSTISTISNSEIDARLNMRVRFRDLAGACVKYDGSDTSLSSKLTRLERSEMLGYDLNVFDIERFETSVTVQWQDLSMTVERSIDLIPDSSLDDEHAAWPGEIAHSLDFSTAPGMEAVERPSRVGVIQTVDAAERMAKIKWAPDAVLEYAIGEKDEAGFRQLLTGAVGVANGAVEEVSLYDIEAPGAMNMRRGDIVLVANKQWQHGNSEVLPRGIDWVGEVVDTCLDGTLVVRLGAADEVLDVRQRREDVVVALRSDGTMDEPAWGEDDDEAMYDEMYDGSDPEDSEDDDEEHDWLDDEEMMDAQAVYEDDTGRILDEWEVENEDWESDAEDEDVPMSLAAREPDEDTTPPTSTSATPPKLVRESQPPEPNDDSTQPTTNATPESPPQYLTLSTAVPANHPHATQSSTNTPAQMRSIQKDHRILSRPSALPEGIYVRTWESRLDLIRVLLIGPEETPYAHAPFVVDLYLPPTYPSEAPKAFFHSWASPGAEGGVGRVNPNLYEDGTICLSLLGTWSGNKGEGWVAGRSTVLQVLVSLLGLVLVREPYFNEAGYEHLAGLDSSRRAAGLYGERVSLRARGFVVVALEDRASSGVDKAVLRGLEGFEDVVKWLYYAPAGPRLLGRVIEESEVVLSRSISPEEAVQEVDGVRVMSKGACIPLRRVLERLRGLQR